jgi:tRNA(Ile)-lysidine synthase
MSSMSPSSTPVSRAETAFLAALAAGLPATHAWTFPSLVGVSGGADSVALLVGLARLVPPPARHRLVVAHADHGLRPDSAADRAFVEDLAEGLGLPCVARRLDLAAERGGEGLEARARRLRYAFLKEAAHRVGARHVLVAHTADDQAETVLHRILRGTGPVGLAGMRRSRTLADGVALVRPLLHAARRLGREFLEATGQAWREDASNRDPSRARNFLRHEVLPRCSAGPYPAAVAALARLAGQAAVTADALASAAEQILETQSRRRSDGAVVLRRAELAGLHPHLQGEVFAALWRREAWPRRDLTAAHYARLADLLAGKKSTAIDFPGGVRATGGPDLITLQPPAALSPRPGRPSRP